MHARAPININRSCGQLFAVSVHPSINPISSSSPYHHTSFLDLEEEVVFCKLEFCKATQGGEIRGKKREGLEVEVRIPGESEWLHEERRGELWPHSSPLSGESLRERPNLDVRALTVPILVRRYPLRAPTTRECIPTLRTGRTIIVCINAIRKSPPDLQFPLAARLRKCAHDTRARRVYFLHQIPRRQWITWKRGFFPDE